MLAGCKENLEARTEYFDKKHVDFLSDYGWRIDRFGSEMKYAPRTMAAFPEHLSIVKAEGHVDLAAYSDKEVIETGYILKEQTDRYNQIVGYIFESEGKIIGSYLEFNQEITDSNGTVRVERGETTPLLRKAEVDEERLWGQITL
ncbi:DUF4830 domain-containing protein [Cohnella sp. AR92]|nr:DUF4830 domain-containing protein [Cohnella sp. AR92]